MGAIAVRTWTRQEALEHLSHVANRPTVAELQEENPQPHEGQYMDLYRKADGLQYWVARGDQIDGYDYAVTVEVEFYDGDRWHRIARYNGEYPEYWIGESF